MKLSTTNLIVQLLIGAVLLCFAVIMLLPLVWMVSASFKYNLEVFAVPIEWIPRHPTLDGYRSLFGAEYNFARYYMNTLYVTLMVLIGTVVVGTMSGYAFAKINFIFRDTIFLFKLAAVTIPFQVLMIPQFIIFKNLGLIDTLTSQWIAFFLGPTMAVFLLRQFFKSLPDEIIDSAKMDGAGHFRICWRIGAPMALPILITVIMLYFVSAWNQYETALLFLRTNDKYVISLAVRMFTQEFYTNHNAIMAASVISIIPMLFLLAWGQKFMISGLTIGGVKG